MSHRPPSNQPLSGLDSVSRREAIQRTLGAAAGVALGAALPAAEPQPLYNQDAPPFRAKRQPKLSIEDHQFLESLEKAAFLYFWENAHPETGLVKDRCGTNGPDDRNMCSIAATGFGLTACCIAASRDYEDGKKLTERVRRTLRYLWGRMHHERGFYYHFVDASTGRRLWQCELSSIDTAILLCGIVTCGEYFVDPEIRDLSAMLFQRVDFKWMLNDGATLSHGWKPESGFLKYRWDSYCELMMLYLLALGADAHRIPVSSWEAWKRPSHQYYGLRYIGSNAPVFVHQYSHAWFDFHGKKDRFANYFDNSLLATEAHRRFCLELQSRYPHFSADLWGITASDSSKGYVVWGGPPEQGPIDGTVVPCASAGSLPFLAEPVLRTLRHMKEVFGNRIWKRYGFVDAFNPATGWVARDVIGINVGITLLMAENARTGFVWDTFMKSKVVQEGMKKANFQPAQAARENHFLAR